MRWYKVFRALPNKEMVKSQGKPRGSNRRPPNIGSNFMCGKY